MITPYGLIFDVDGVIADTEPANAQATIKVFRDLFGLHGVQPKDFEAGLGRGAAEYVRAAARIHGLELTDEQVTAATTARQDNFLMLLKDTPIKTFPGVLELINSALERDDFRLAIATSGTREKSEAVLQSARVPYQQMVYVTGSDVANKKPHPELFLTAAARIRVPPENCVVIEDAPDGILAAHNAGCKCLAVTNSADPETLAEADFIVTALDKVGIETITALI
ncbi:MAG: HAD family hydrolase [Planctomycetota bacterium]|jgi:beta-phosphoglucomutase-like phosphatase (HAD superfamily)